MSGAALRCIGTQLRPCGLPGSLILAQSLPAILSGTTGYTPLRSQWENIITPLVKHLLLQVRMNLKKRCVELKTSRHTVSASALQKGCDFVQAFMPVKILQSIFTH